MSIIIRNKNKNKQKLKNNRILKTILKQDEIPGRH
jgi:hypothetical protein